MKTYIVKYERTLYFEAETEDEAMEAARQSINEEAYEGGLEIKNFTVIGCEA